MWLSSMPEFGNGKSWGREVAAQREMKYIQCFPDYPIMESSSNFILLSSSIEKWMLKVIPNSAKRYFI